MPVAYPPQEALQPQQLAQEVVRVPEQRQSVDMRFEARPNFIHRVERNAHDVIRQRGRAGEVPGKLVASADEERLKALDFAPERRRAGSRPRLLGQDLPKLDADLGAPAQ